MDKSWQRFIARYLVTGVWGSVLVVACAPFVRGSALGRQLDGIAPVVRSVPGLDAFSMSLGRRLDWKRAGEPELAPVTTPVTAGQETVTPQPASRTTARSVHSSKTRRAATPQRQVNARNPYAREYADARAAYQKFRKKAEALTAKRDTAVGDERLRCMDELRRMRADNVRLGRAYEAARKRYDAWNRSQNQ